MQMNVITLISWADIFKRVTALSSPPGHKSLSVLTGMSQTKVPDLSGTAVVDR